MAKTDSLIDSHVSVKQCKRAIEALHAFATKLEKQRAETELLPDKEQHIWLQITVKTMYPEQKIKPFRIAIKYPLVDPRTSGVCLITKDPQRQYKDLLEQHNIKFISRVVGVEKLKGKFKAFEARRLLLKENAMFLADERVIPLLPRLLGSKWFEAKKQPIPVCLTRKDLKAELERAIESSYMHQNKGTCTSVKIGLVSHTPKQVQVNLETALPAIVSHIKGGWENIQSLHIKTSTSVSLPIWACDLSTEDGGRWNGLVAEAEGDEEKVQSEASAEETDEEMEGAEDVGEEEEEEDDAEEDEEEDVKVKVKAKKVVKQRKTSGREKPGKGTKRRLADAAEEADEGEEVKEKVKAKAKEAMKLNKPSREEKPVKGAKRRLEDSLGGAEEVDEDVGEDEEGEVSVKPRKPSGKEKLAKGTKRRLEDTTEQPKKRPKSSARAK